MVAFKIIRGFLQIGAEKSAIVAKMPKLTSQPLDADLMVRNDGWQTHHHHKLSLLGVEMCFARIQLKQSLLFCVTWPKIM